MLRSGKGKEKMPAKQLGRERKPINEKRFQLRLEIGATAVPHTVVRPGVAAAGVSKSESPHLGGVLPFGSAAAANLLQHGRLVLAATERSCCLFRLLFLVLAPSSVAVTSSIAVGGGVVESQRPSTSRKRSL